MNEKKGKTGTGEKNQIKVQPLFKMPKNIRQVGQINEAKKIYIEDYVMTYIKQMGAEEYATGRMAVLVGKVETVENKKNIFIYGALGIENYDLIEEGILTNDHWTYIYETTKQYYKDAEIVGWCLTGPGFVFEKMETIRKLHVDNFAGQDKTLLLYETVEKEEAFYLYEHSVLRKQSGYYIYYEKNEAMQNYMLDHSLSAGSDAGYEDKAAKEIRQVLQNKKEEKSTRSSIRFMYAAGTVMAVVLLVIAATMLNNFEQMRNLERVLETLSGEMGEETENLVKKNNDIESEQTVENNKEEKDNDNEENEADYFTQGTGKVTEIQYDDMDQVMNQEEKKETEKEVKEETPSKKQQMEKSAKEEQMRKQLEIQTQKGTNDASLITTDESEEIKTKQTKKEDQSKNKEETSFAEEAEENYEAIPAGTGTYHTYVVEYGDTLAGVCLKLYGSFSHLDEICEINEINDQNVIFEGQKLMVP